MVYALLAADEWVASSFTVLLSEPRALQVRTLKIAFIFHYLYTPSLLEVAKLAGGILTESADDLTLSGNVFILEGSICLLPKLENHCQSSNEAFNSSHDI